MTRGNARELAVHLIYSREFTGQEPEQEVAVRLDKEYYPSLSQENAVYADRPSAAQLRYIDSVVSGVANRENELNEQIRKFSIGWDISRISRLTRCAAPAGYLRDPFCGGCANRCRHLGGCPSGEDVRRRRGRFLHQRHSGCLRPEPPPGGEVSMGTIGIDTSNYTTSIAFFDGDGGRTAPNYSRSSKGAGSAPVRCGICPYQKPAGAVWQAIFPY